jgi:hypothetical protein
MTAYFLHQESWTGERVLRLVGGTTEEVVDEVRNTDFDWLYLDSGDWTDIAFLADCKKKIRALDIGSSNCDWEVVSQLSYLERLSVGVENQIRYSQLARLRKLDVSERRAYTEEIFQLDLEYLSLVGFPEADLCKVRCLPNLKGLSLTDAKRLTTMDGTESLKKLLSLQLVSCSSLTNIKSLSKLEQLRSLRFESCKRIEDYAPISKLSNLLELYIINSAPLPSVKLLTSLPELDAINLADTSVEKGDVSALLLFPKLKLVTFRNKRNFDMKLVDVQKKFKEKWGEQMDWNKSRFLPVDMS